MIVVKNTKELEENYDLRMIPDNEQIRVVGGMYGKDKYNEERYIRRTTYSARQLKQIIQEMKEIEMTIPKNWDEWQRAKYIYTVLAQNIGYNRDKESYGNQQSSNLTILLSKAGICAGYSLLFKEMMDRQGIECDYIRGVAKTARGKLERHAWNVLTIEGTSVPIDLTWDSDSNYSGEYDLKYFGNNKNFFECHEQDKDEKEYQFMLFTSNDINSIDINNTQEITLEKKQELLSSAIIETYEKFEKIYGAKQAKEHIIAAVKQYIEEGNPQYFTRQQNARENVEKYISKEDMLDLLIGQYVVQCSEKEELIPENILENSLKQNILKYGKEQAQVAVKNYILSGDTQGFTRQNNARKNIESYMTRRISIRYYDK